MITERLTLLPPAMPPTALPDRQSPADSSALRERAVGFETVFVSEMLRHAGLGREPEALGGGFGAEAFGSMLTTALAERLVERADFGIAEAVRERLER